MTCISLLILRSTTTLAPGLVLHIILRPQFLIRELCPLFCTHARLSLRCQPKWQDISSPPRFSYHHLVAVEPLDSGRASISQPSAWSFALLLSGSSVYPADRAQKQGYLVSRRMLVETSSCGVVSNIAIRSPILS